MTAQASLNTIRFYIILKPPLPEQFKAVVWILYVFTSFSNRHVSLLSIWLVWILYVFTSFSNFPISFNFKCEVWILYVFTSFSNYQHKGVTTWMFEYYTFLHHSQTSYHKPIKLIFVWILYVFTSFSNLSKGMKMEGCVWILYVFTSFSNSMPSGTRACWFEYYTFLHHSQTGVIFLSAPISLNTIRFYIILKPE